MQNNSISSKKRKFENVVAVDTPSKINRKNDTERSSAPDEPPGNKSAQGNLQDKGEQVLKIGTEINHDYESSKKLQNKQLIKNTAKTANMLTKQNEDIIENGKLEDAKCNEKETNDEKFNAFSNTAMKSESIKLYHPICPLCHEKFDIHHLSDQTPVMSMSCEHTVCRNCAIVSIKNNQLKLRKMTVSSAPCPMKNCLSRNAFRLDRLNDNIALITVCRNIFHMN